MSLRLRLIVGLAVLVVLGLAVFGTTTYVSVSHYLTQRLDSQLADASRALTGTGAAFALSTGHAPQNEPFGPAQGQPGPSDGNDYGQENGTGQTDDQIVRNAVGPELYVEFVDHTGRVFEQITATVTGELVGVQPVLPASVLAEIAPPSGNGGGSPKLGNAANIHVDVRTLSTVSGASDERVAVALPPAGGAIVVASSLSPVTQTLQRLLAVELGVGLPVLALSFGLGLALARQATRPLEEIAVTADAIAAGDLDRRVPAANNRTEAGRVAAALNAMLSRIQEAFARRDATEARLRTFVADASHELSTPLTSIRGYAELFHRGLQDRPEDLKKALERIESEAVRMGLLVDDLSALASFDAGRPLRQDLVDLSRIAGDAASDLRAIDRDRAVTLEAGLPVIVVGDEQRLRQVAANLVSNVGRHTPAGTAVTIRARVAGGAGVFEVADAGPGMTPEQAEHVFDRFYRVDKARSRAMGGAGLGLSIVASIAEAHGGQASVATAPGAGSTFSVTIPLAGPSGPPPAGAPTPPPGQQDARLRAE